MLLDRIINRLKGTFYFATCIQLDNPGINITSVLTLGGFGLLAISALLHQLGYGEIDPFVIELGKAAFYSGMGRAYTQAESKDKVEKKDG